MEHGRVGISAGGWDSVLGGLENAMLRVDRPWKGLIPRLAEACVALAGQCTPPGPRPGGASI